MNFGSTPALTARYQYPGAAPRLSEPNAISKPTYAEVPPVNPGLSSSNTPDPNYDPNKVRPAKCKTCPYRGQSALADLVPELVTVALTQGNHFCHAEQLQGLTPTWHCRGTRDIQLQAFYKMGVLEEPTDQCWAETLAKLRSGAR
jgi:hypothetical protein